MGKNDFLTALRKCKPVQKSKYIAASMTRSGSIAAVERILANGCTETGEKLRITTWFRQQLRLTADNRLRHVLTTGASQISKSLANYLVAIDELINCQINIGWIYASRQSMINQQPSQFQAMVKAWKDKDKDVGRDSVFRYQIGSATAIFSYANSSTQKGSGGAAEGKEQNSFQASKLYFEEKSSWKPGIDLTPRLGASKLPSKPIRELGTPGAGGGIEELIRQAEQNFEPGLICPHCGQLSWLHPLGNLFKPEIKPDKIEYFTVRGEIIDFWGTERDPFVACSHCNGDITGHISKCQLYSRQTEQTADEFLDELPDNEIYYPSVSIYLSPLLKVPDDKYRLRDLVSEGLDPNVPLIYHQNKLGIESKFTINVITYQDYRAVARAPVYTLKKPVKIIGIDQGMATHYLVEMQFDLSAVDKTNICNVVEISHDGILPYLRNKNIDFGIIDNEPGRLSASELCKASGDKLGMADQRAIMSDFSKIKATFGKLELDCYAITDSVFKEFIFKNFINCLYRIDCNPHRKFEKHITSISRDIQTGEFLRPANHDDDFFFALMFAESAKAIYLKNFKPMSSSNSVGAPLTNYSYGRFSPASPKIPKKYKP